MTEGNPMQSNQVEADRMWVQSQLGTVFHGFCSRWRDKNSNLNMGGHETVQEAKRLLIGDQALGWLHGTALARVTEGLQALRYGPETYFGLSSDIHIPLEDAHRILTDLGEWLHRRSWVPTWRDEPHTVHQLNGDPLFELERGMFKMLGLRSQAVHIHIETPDGLVWVGRRSIHKKENPGMLDNLSAGGIGAGELPWDCAWRELDEEAGLMPLQVDLKQARDPILVSRSVGIGWHHETIHLFKGIVPRNWTPKNRDGEVQGFELMTREACINAVNQWRFTPDAGLVTALLLSNP